MTPNNSFQEWAIKYARAFGFQVYQKGNWVTLHRHGQEWECMSAPEVQRICDEHGK